MIEGFKQYSRIEIEEKAEEIFRAWFPEYLIKSKIFPWERFCKKIIEKYGVKVTLDANLGRGPGGYPIFGAFSLSPWEIFIDKSIRRDKRFLLVLAHEIGHLILHRHLKFDEGQNNLLSDTRATILSANTLINEGDIIEWQANTFASSILMPRATFHLALFRAMSIARRTPKRLLVVTNHIDSLDDYERIVTEMARWSFVSKTAIKIRLRELQLVTGPGAQDGHIATYI